MYQILCDNEIIYDPRIELLKVLEPRCKLEVNTVGEASFDMLPAHPYYLALKPLKSVIEIKQGNHILFRGRMTNNSREIYNRLSVDLEGVLATTNGSYVPPFSFPDDFTIPDGANVVEVLLSWFLDVHNSQVQPWQRLKLGTVTVTDPNNVIVRSSEKFLSTWDCLREKLFDSSLGGKLYARYEADGTYVDYVSSYALTNVQRIKLGTNILGLDQKLDGQKTYSAILPIGKDGMTIADLEDGDITTDFVKQGNFIYSKQAVESYGWACAPVSDTTWDDVTEITNLRRKAVDALSDMVQLVREITVTALDQNFTDEQVQSLRAFRNVIVESSPHDLNTELFPLDRLDIDLHNPQNTKITVGKSSKTMAESTSQRFSDSIIKAEQAASIAQGVNKKVDSLRNNLSEVKQQVVSLETSMVSTAESIIMAAMADYVKTGDYESYQETVKSQLSILANEITMKFTSVTEQVQDVDGDMQSRFEALSKYIKYSGETAVSISSGNSVIVLELDNEKGIVFKKNGVQFGWWDGTDFHTGNIVVEVNERAQFGDFAWVPRSDRSLMFLKVAGVTEEPPALDIIQEPASTSAKVGESFTFTIHAVGDNVQYQWQVNSGSSWADLPNGNMMSYTGIAQSGCDGWKYRCVVSDDSGDSMESTEAILSIEVDFKYTVNPISGATYGFALNSDGWYESQNKGVHSTYAVCRINFQCSVDTPIYICCINSGEQGYDYGIVGKLDTALTATITDTDYLWKATSSSTSAIVDVDLTVPAGSHFVDVKYRKDGSQNSGNDSLQFMIEVA